MAIHCLSELAPERPEANGAVLGAIDDPAVAVRRAALTAAAALREPSAGIYAALTAALDDPNDAPGRTIAALSLGRLAESQGSQLPAEVRSALEHAARSADSALQAAARRSLGNLP